MTPVSELNVLLVLEVKWLIEALKLFNELTLAFKDAVVVLIDAILASVDDV